MHKTPHERGDGTEDCPQWCRRDHRMGGHADDMLHQSRPAFVALVHGDLGLEPGPDPGLDDSEARWDADLEARADAVVLRLVQRGRSSTVWLEAASEEGRRLHLLISAESADRLARAMTDLLEAL